MVDALLDLDHVLWSKRVQLSVVEANAMMAWKIRAKMNLYAGLGGASVVTWLATKKLRNPLRGVLTLGAGLTYGVWLTSRSLESSVDHILSLEGSRIQRELAILMLQRSHDPRVQHRLSKHFYSEEVYNDSSVDRPMFRWRYKKFSGDVTRSQGISYGEVFDPKENNMKKTATMEPKQIYVRAAAAYVRAADDCMENPFDLIFGHAESVEDTPEPDTPTASSRRQTRKEKRSRRRRRRNHHEESEE